MTITAYAGKAEDYAAYRPPYSPAGIETLCECVGLDASWTVADIGSGTGNVSRHLVGRVSRVFAVEPDDAMRQESEALLGTYPSFVSVAGTAEVTTLPDRSVDLITVGQALHWFEAERAYCEFDRILKPNGWLAILWNRFGMEADTNMSVFLREAHSSRFSFPVTIQEDWKQFIGGARSAARAPNLGDDGYEDFERGQKSAFDARATNGLITVTYATELVVGRMNRRTTGSRRCGKSCA